MTIKHINISIIALTRSCIHTLITLLIGTSLHPLKAQDRLPHRLFTHVNEKSMMQWVDSVYSSLSEEERLAQLIMPIIHPTNDPTKIRLEEERVKRYKWGGILYQKGLMREQLQMNEQLQRASQVPMLVALDGEWGLYMRLKDAPRFPRNLGLGLSAHEEVLYSYGREVARQCRLMGIHINFAPTVDVNINPRNPVIGSRSFGDKPLLVSRLSRAYARGLETGGVLSVAKHFPGHGDTTEDSHKTLPTIFATRERLRSVELNPFKDYIDDGLGGIMVAHLRVPSLDASEVPSSLSPIIVKQLLKRDMGFKGLIFTDALEMKGAKAKSHTDLGVSALLAGNDILLGAIDPIKQLKALVDGLSSGLLSREIIRERVTKVLCYKYRLIVSVPKEVASPKTIKEAIWTKEARDIHHKLWMSSLHFCKKTTNLSEELSKGMYPRVAVVNWGDSPAKLSRPPRQGLGGCRIDYISWGEAIVSGRSYDLLMLNAFKGMPPIKEITALSKTTTVCVTYYKPIFRFKEEPWMKGLKQVILATEACSEAQRAVLALLTGTSIHDIDEVRSSRTAQEDNDPTAQREAN